MAENSPTFQRRGREFRGARVPKGRLKPCAIRQPSLRDLSDHGRWFPTLKRWAIIVCPSGTVAECPSLPGCISQGKTRAEALTNIKDAMTGYLASLKKHGEPVPLPISEEIVEIPA